MSKDVERRRPIISIMGDRFMLPSMFERAIREKCGEALEIRSYEMPWPDEPMEHGYAEPGMEGLKEYQGTADEVVAHMDGAEIAVTHLAPFSARVLERLPQLKLIAVSRGGPVNIDMAAARKRKIRVVNTPGRNASAVAEFAIGAILAETRLITRGHESLRRGEWRGDLYRADLTGEELSEMTVGVIGYGHIGTKVVRILKAFGCRILVCDPYVQLSADDLRDGVVQVSLERLLRESDVVTLHARVTEETRGFIGKEQFEQMKRGAYFVNQSDFRRRASGRALVANCDEPFPSDDFLHPKGAVYRLEQYPAPKGLGAEREDENGVPRVTEDSDRSRLSERVSGRRRPRSGARRG